MFRNLFVWVLVFIMILSLGVESNPYRSKKDCKMSLVKCVRDMGHARMGYNVWDECRKAIHAEQIQLNCVSQRQKNFFDF